MVSMILAVDRDNKIGHTDGRLPWDIPEDMARFKRLTTGKTILMGGNTYRSLNRPHGLPNRHNVVLTTGCVEDWSSGDGWSSIRQIDDLDVFTFKHHFYWVIGGAQIYDWFVDELMVDTIYLTRVHQTTEASVGVSADLYNVENFIADQLHRFGAIWQIIEEEDHEGFQFVTLEKIYYES